VSRVLLLTGDGGEGYEAWYAIHRLREAGHEAVVAAPSRRRLHMVMHGFEPGWDTYVERPGYGVNADIAVADVDAAGFDAVLILGGRAPEYLRHNAQVLDMIRAFAVQGKWLFAICHGIQVFNAAGVVAGWGLPGLRSWEAWLVGLLRACPLIGLCRLIRLGPPTGEPPPGRP